MSGPYGPNDPNWQWGPGHPEQTGAEYPAPQYGQQPPSQSWGHPVQGQPQWGPPPGQDQQWAPIPTQPQPGPFAPPGQPVWGPPPGQAQQWGPPQQWAPVAQQQFPGQQQQFPGQQQWGAPPAKTTRSTLPLIIGGAVGLAVIIGIAVVLAFTVFGRDTLDRKAAEQGVERIVTDSYGARTVTDVTCPSGQQVKKGRSFQCDLTVDGQTKKVTLTFTDDTGTYEVSRPS